jgi:hypothetical protein
LDQNIAKYPAEVGSQTQSESISNVEQYQEIYTLFGINKKMKAAYSVYLLPLNFQKKQLTKVPCIYT